MQKNPCQIRLIRVIRVLLGLNQKFKIGLERFIINKISFKILEEMILTRKILTI